MPSNIASYWACLTSRSIGSHVGIHGSNQAIIGHTTSLNLGLVMRRAGTKNVQVGETAKVPYTREWSI